MNIEKAIVDESRKLIHRQQRVVARNNAHRKRFQKATGIAGGAQSHLPPHWSVDDIFNPFKVKKKARLIASSIQHQLDEHVYRPRPALIREIDKPGGGKRPLSIFPVADAALGAICFRRLARRNQHRLSPFSFAFRHDVGVHEAIESIWREIQLRNRYWVVEFDFSKYFDTINHEYVLRVMSDSFGVTKTERQIIEALLGSRRAFGMKEYRRREFVSIERGIPQGNSLSLFLANVACHELDVSLARTAAIFARYADDILLLCKSSVEADEAAELVLNHCDKAGLAVNFDKSDGISRFGPEWVARRHQSRGEGGKLKIDYLGYSFSYRSVGRRGTPAPHVVRRLSIRERTLDKIRAKLSNIIYCHLLRYPEKGLFAQARVDAKAQIDWDLVTCINDIRVYMYGGISEDELRKALADRSVRLHLNRGVLAFYPLVTDVEQLKQMDGWLANAIARGVARRKRILEESFQFQNYPVVSLADLLKADWYDDTKAPVHDGTGDTIKNDVRLPSFVRIWKYGQRCLRAFNLNRFPFRDGES